MRGVGSLVTAFQPAPILGPPPIIASLPCSLYYEGQNYAFTTPSGVPHGVWSGTATAGTSGSSESVATQNDVVTPGLTPTVGATLNGKATVSLSGTSWLNINSWGALVPNPLPPGDWTCFAVVNWNAAGAPNNGVNAAYDNEAILSDNGANRFNLTNRANHAQILIDPGSGRVGTETVANPDGTWEIIMARGNGTRVDLRENSAAYVTFLCGHINVGAAPRIGISSNPPGAKWKGLMAAVGMVYGHFCSDAEMDAIKAELNYNWGLSV